MIGERVEDQFVITAVETIQNEITKITETCEDDIEKMEAEFRDNCNKLWGIMLKKNKENKKQIADEEARLKENEPKSFFERIKYYLIKKYGWKKS